MPVDFVHGSFTQGAMGHGGRVLVQNGAAQGYPCKMVQGYRKGMAQGAGAKWRGARVLVQNSAVQHKMGGARGGTKWPSVAQGARRKMAQHKGLGGKWRHKMVRRKGISTKGLAQNNTRVSAQNGAAQGYRRKTAERKGLGASCSGNGAGRKIIE